MARPSKNPVLVGQKFERLTVVGKTVKIVGKGYESSSVCKCDCGNEKIVLDYKLKNNHTQSCGCLQKEKVKKRLATHGLSKSSTHNIWQTMIQRCTNPNNKKYNRYGGRGITVCQRWLNSFENFYADMGVRPEGLSIERINNDLGYSPENCKWATSLEQANNKGIRKNNTSGITGVHKHKSGLWVICIANGKQKYNKDFFEACCIRKSYELTRGNNG